MMIFFTINTMTTCVHARALIIEIVSISCGNSVRFKTQPLLMKFKFTITSGIIKLMAVLTVWIKVPFGNVFITTTIQWRQITKIDWIETKIIALLLSFKVVSCWNIYKIKNHSKISKNFQNFTIWVASSVSEECANSISSVEIITSEIFAAISWLCWKQANVLLSADWWTSCWLCNLLRLWLRLWSACWLSWWRCSLVTSSASWITIRFRIEAILIALMKIKFIRNDFKGM